MAHPYRAVICDLLTALVDSWSLWADVAGDPDGGRRWREASLRLVTAAGAYRPYEAMVVEAATAVGVPAERATALLDRWDELTPYPDVPPVLASVRAAGYRLGIVTNCSQPLARLAADRVGVPFDAVVSAERAGFYKLDPRAYLAGCADLDVEPSAVLFVAGSPHDVPGAGGAGLDVYWANRSGLPLPAGSRAVAVRPDLNGLLDILGSA